MNLACISIELRVDALSFIEENALFELLFQLCDMDGDGKINGSDVSLFVVLEVKVDCYFA